MPLQFAWKKVVIGALALSLVFGSALTAPSAVNAAATGLSTPFTDISRGHWAEKHIAKLALQGIITGYTKGDSFVFLPAQSVSQEEAVLMALRFAGLDDKVNQNAIIGFPASFGVSNYFKSYVELAFSEGILDREQEYQLAASNAKTTWGKLPASREWVTKLIIRAIGKEAEAVRLENTGSAFADAGSVSSIYKGYVNAAAELELVKGITSTKFDPKANENRASLATIFSRAQKMFPVEYAGQTKGIVTSITDSSISIYSGKQETTYSISADTLFYHYNTETPISKDKLIKYGDVTVIAKAGKALYVEVLGEDQHVKTITGKLDRVIADSNMLYIWINNKPVEVYYKDSVEIVDNAGKTLALNAIKRDSQITIVQDTFRESPLAVKITAEPQTTATSVKGTFYITDGKLITIKEGAALVTKFMAGIVTVEIEGISGATTDDLLKEADEVELTLNDKDEVTKIKVVNRNVGTLAGAQIASFVYDKNLLTIVDSNGNNAQALYFTDKTKIIYSGNPITLSSAYNLLTANRKIVISYTGNTIVRLEFVTKYTGALQSVNATGKTITVRLDSGAVVTMPYTTVNVEIGGRSSAALSDLSAGDLLTLELTNAQDKVTTVKKHSSIQYDVVSLDVTNKKIRLKNASTAAFDLSVLSTELMNEVGATLSIDQIKIGSIVNISYVGVQPTTLRTVTPAYGTVKAITATSVTITDLTGKTLEYPSLTDILVIEGGSQSSVTSAMSVGDYVEVVKGDGNKTQFTIAVAESREFTRLDTTASQLWTLKVTDSDNRNYFNITNQTKFTQNGNVIAPSALKAGDEILVYALRNIAIEIVKK